MSGIGRPPPFGEGTGLAHSGGFVGSNPTVYTSLTTDRGTMRKALFLTLLALSTNAFADWKNPSFLWSSDKNIINRVSVTIRHVDNVKQACETESRNRGKGGFGTMAMQACSFWEGSACTIILPKKFTIDNLGHEMLHCMQGNYHD